MALFDFLTNWKKNLGLGQVNLIPGDVTRMLTSKPAPSVYGAPSGFSYSSPEPVIRSGIQTTSAPALDLNKFLSSQAGGSAPGGGTTGGGGAGTTSTGGGDTGTTGGGGDGGQPSGPSNEDISSAYGPALSALDQWMRQVETNQTANFADVNAAVTQGQQSIAGQQKEGEEFQSNQQSNLSQQLASALAMAVNNRNALERQGRVLYGGGSSVGPAITDLVNKAFGQAQGQLQNTAQTGFQEIQAQSQKLKNYITEKTATLDQWKRQADQQIRDNFTNALAQIGAQRGVIGANQTNAKLAALQYAQQQAESVKNTDQDYRRQLAAWAVEQAQSAQQRSFSPSEIASIYNNMMGQNLQGLMGQRISRPSAVAQARMPGGGKSVEEQLREQGLA